MNFILYTRKQCPLCEDARQMLELFQEELGYTIEERDIEENDKWLEQFGLMIPVLEIDGEIVQYGSIDPSKLEKDIKGQIN